MFSISQTDFKREQESEAKEQNTLSVIITFLERENMDPWRMAQDDPAATVGSDRPSLLV